MGFRTTADELKSFNNKLIHAFEQKYKVHDLGHDVSPFGTGAEKKRLESNLRIVSAEGAARDVSIKYSRYMGQDCIRVAIDKKFEGNVQFTYLPWSTKQFFRKDVTCNKALEKIVRIVDLDMVDVSAPKLIA